MRKKLRICRVPTYTSTKRNPVRELDIPEREREQLRRNAERQLGGQGAQVRKAAQLYTDFTGHDDIEVRKVQAPKQPKVLSEIGHIDGVLYTTVRDGKTEKYIHRFKKNCRPLFCVSPDGKQLIMLGGAYTFGERGIVDDERVR